MIIEAIRRLFAKRSKVESDSTEQPLPDTADLDRWILQPVNQQRQAVMSHPSFPLATDPQDEE